jgi:hypothetical protein
MYSKIGWLTEENHLAKERTMVEIIQRNCLLFCLYKSTFSSTVNYIVLDVLKAFLGNVSVHTFPRLRNNRRSGVFSVLCRVTAVNAWIAQEWGESHMTSVSPQ